MRASPEKSPIGVLTSGGLDSSILVGHLLAEGRTVQPFYIRTDLVWQQRELAALKRYLDAIASPNLRELVVLDLPLRDLYATHWSTTGRDTPNAVSPDEAVYLPGRNALLIVKTAVWCQMNGVTELALAPLGTSPFEDAGAGFFRDFQSAMNRGSETSVTLLRPFGQMNKQQVMQLGRNLPLELTFSCIHPKNGQHCGECNKCAERRAAFDIAGLHDRTSYANVCEAA